MAETVAGVTLQDGEEVRHSFRPSWGAYFWSIVLTLGLWLPIVWWKRRKVRYVVTDQRVIHKRGRVSASTDEFRLADVARLRTDRSLGERILGGGTITLDTGVDEITIPAVPSHGDVAASIREGQTT